MELNSDTLAGRFSENCSLILSEYRKVWIGLLEKELRDYLNNLRNFLDNDQKTERNWLDAESFLQSQTSWCCKTEKILQDYRKGDFWEISNRHFNSVYKDNPENIDVPVQPQDWEAGSSDTKFISLWKLFYRSRYRMRVQSVRAVNKIRALFKKAPLEMPQLASRKVSVHLLTARFIQWPFNRRILHEWKAFQMEAGKIIFELHQHSKKFLKTPIFNNKDFDLSEDGKNREIQEVRKKLTETFQAVQKRIDSFINNSMPDPEVATNPIEALNAQFALKWRYCGTTAQRHSGFDAKSISRERQKISDDLQKSNVKWELQFTGEYGNWRRDLQWTLLRMQAITIGEQLLQDTRDNIETDILPEFSKNITLVEKCIENVKNWTDLNHIKTLAALKRENRQLIKALGHERLLMLTDEVMQTKLQTSFQNYLTLLTEETARIPEKQALLVKRQLDQLIPNPKIEFIPSKELVEIYGLQPLISIHSKLMRDAENTYRGTLRTISMMDQILNFQFETAVTLIQQKRSDESLDETKQILIEGLERLVSQFRDLSTENQAFIENSRDTIEKMTWGFIDSIQMLDDSERVFELNLKLTRAKTKAHYRLMQKMVLVKIRSSTVSTLKLTNNVLKGIFLSYKRLRKITGIEESQVRVEDQIQRLLTISYSPLDKLPIVYQRLFKIDASNEERFFFPRQVEFNALQDEFHNWQDDPTSPVALVGEKGSGKSTLINHVITRIYIDYPVFTCTPLRTVENRDDLLKLLLSAFGLEGVDSLELLENKILEEGEPCVMIFENIQRLFLRKVGGFKELQRLLLFVSRTSRKIHWLMSCSLYCWEFLDKAINCSKYFHKIIHLEELSVEEIRDIIMKRHRTSGFEVVFQPSPSMLKSSRYRKLLTEKERQNLLSDLFFKDLQEIAQGNIVVAMLFWITAIKEIRKDELVLNTVLSWDQSPFQKLPPDELFTLAAVIQHDGLTVAQHSKVFYQDLSRSQAITTRMKNNGLLIENEFGYSIQPILYRPIVQVLKNKNILH